jgi:lantibiotic biosynthesis protein
MIEPLINQNIVSKLLTDTYKRELNRYGTNSIELAELLFFNDSAFVLEILSSPEITNGAGERWQIAIRSVDEFLTDFKFSVENKLKLIDWLYNGLFNEHGGKKHLKLKLDSKYRIVKQKVENVLNATVTMEDSEFTSLIQLINKRSVENRPIVDQILQLNINSQLQVSLEGMLGSLIHMNLDRLFMGRNRTNEFVVYDILCRHYRSQIARGKKSLKPSVLSE